MPKAPSGGTTVLSELSALINVDVTKEETVKSLNTISSTKISDIRVTLFEEARNQGLVHQCDVIITRRATPLRNVHSAHCNDIIMVTL